MRAESDYNFKDLLAEPTSPSFLVKKKSGFNGKKLDVRSHLGQTVGAFLRKHANMFINLGRESIVFARYKYGPRFGMFLERNGSAKN